FRFSHDGLVVCDGNGYGVRYNEAYTRITGIDGQELIGRHMTEIIGKGCISESAVLNALQARKQVTTMPKLLSGKKTLITANPVFDANNNILKVICNVRDITERIALESQLDQAK
ncbi:PAS domain S-box protein, partial [bacterium]|nr:PAS domain S-box protein [bacterium]